MNIIKKSNKYYKTHPGYVNKETYAYFVSRWQNDERGYMEEKVEKQDGNLIKNVRVGVYKKV